MTNIELIIENTRLKYSSVILEESEIPTKESLRLQRMINESTSSIKKTLKGGLLEEARELYIDMAKKIIEEALSENVKKVFKKSLLPAAAILGAGASVIGGEAIESNSKDYLIDSMNHRNEAKLNYGNTSEEEYLKKIKEADELEDTSNNIHAFGTTTRGIGGAIGAGILTKKIIQQQQKEKENSK